MRTIEIDGEALRLARHPCAPEQRQRGRVSQPTLFELKEDARPPAQRSAAGRYAEPTLFDEDGQ